MVPPQAKALHNNYYAVMIYIFKKNYAGNSGTTMTGGKAFWDCPGATKGFQLQKTLRHGMAIPIS